MLAAYPPRRWCGFLIARWCNDRCVERSIKMSFLNQLFGRGKKDTESRDETPKTELSPPRRLPIYLLLDTSDSMTGAPIQVVNEGINLLCNDLVSDRNAIKVVHIAVIAFHSQAQWVVPLTPLTQFSPPMLSAGDGSSLGAALHLLSESLDHDILPDTPEQQGDYKPLVFLVLGGSPTDDWELEARALKNRAVTVIALGCGTSIDVGMLKQITEVVLVTDAVAKSKTDQVPGVLDIARRVSKHEYAELVHDLTSSPSSDVPSMHIPTQYFKWVSQSISVASASALKAGKAQAQLPPPPSGVQVVL
jgi:uncharacterized protein YegL